MTSKRNSVPSLALVMVLSEALIHRADKEGVLEVSLILKSKLARLAPVVLFLKYTLPVLPELVMKFSNTCAVNCMSCLTLLLITISRLEN